MKNVILKTALSAVLAFSAIPKAEAVTLIASGGALAVVTLVLNIGIGSVVLAFGKASPAYELAAAISFIGAGVSLDAKSNSVEFKEISIEENSRLGLTNDEFVAYNEELPQINLMLSEASKYEHIALNKDQANLVRNELVQSVGLSDEALGGLTKVLRAAIKQQ